MRGRRARRTDGVHGAAGVGHLFGVLPSLALPPAEAALYLGAYFCGAVLAMSGVGLGLGLVARERSSVFVRGLMIASGLGALSVGAWWLITGWG